MLKNLQKLENSLNKLLLKLIALWWLIVHKILPNSFFQYINRQKTNLKKLKEDCKNAIIQSFIQLKNKILDTCQSIKELIGQLSQVSLGSKVKNELQKTKEKLQKTPLKSPVNFISNYFAPRFKRWEEIFKKYSSSQLYIALTALAMITFGSYGIYHSSRDIYKKEFAYRSPASVQEYDYRPDYLMYKRKTVSFFNIKIPITVENVGDINSITIDISVRTSTRWARYFLANADYKLKDYFFTSVEPVISDFPLEDEGKQILKDKIKLEINNFLREHNVEGKVEDVRIVYIVAS